MSIRIRESALEQLLTPVKGSTMTTGKPSGAVAEMLAKDGTLDDLIADRGLTFDSSARRACTRTVPYGI